MSSTVALSQPKSARPIIVAGILAGSLDILAAFAIWMSRGVTPTRVLSVASGLLGRESYADDRIALKYVDASDVDEYRKARSEFALLR